VSRQLRGARTVLVRIVLWNLADSLSSIGELRRYLQDEAVDAFEQVPGLLFKAWFSDDVTERWGAVYVFETREASEQDLPSRARELIGKEPDVVEIFDLEASVSVAAELARLGIAFE
jgi:Putative mono-oxygenase ydhR